MKDASRHNQSGITASIDDVCDEFERHWQAGAPRPIGEFVDRVTGQEQARLVCELAMLDASYLQRQGGVPNWKALQVQFPGFKDAIREAYRKFSSAAKTAAWQPEHELDTAKPKHAAGAQASAKAKLPRRFGHFEVRTILGRGAFGTVFRAYDTRLHRDVALKIPRGGVLVDSDHAERFIREARAASQLRHPSIVTVHDVGEVAGTVYIACEFIDGPTLQKLLADGYRPKARQVASFMRSLAVALHSAHSRGIIHRDLKPANILLDGKGKPHIADFGLARTMQQDSGLTIEGTVLGTPAYMSPEQAFGRSHLADARSDLWSLGVIFYELLTERRPFQGPTAEVLEAIRTKAPAAPRAIDASISRDLDQVCMKCLAKEPDERYPSAQHLVDDLDRWRAGKPVHARPIGSAERVFRWAKSNPTISLLMTATAATIVIGIVSIAAQWRRAESNLVESNRQRARAEESQRLAERLRQTAETERVTAEKARMSAVDARKNAEKSAELESQARADAESARVTAERAVALEADARATAERELHKSLVSEARLLRLSRTQSWQRAAIEKLVQASELQSDAVGIQQIRSEAIMSACGVDVSESGRLHGYWQFGRLKGAPGSRGVIWSMSFNRTGDRLASVDEAGNLRTWDVTNLKAIDLLPATTPSPGMYSLCFHPTTDELVYSARPNWIDIFVVGSARPASEWLRTPGSVRSISFGPEGKLVGVACNEGVAALFTEDRKQLRKWEIERGQDFCPLAISPDGSRVAYVGKGHAILSGSADTPKTGTVLGHHRRKIRDLTFSPDGRLLAVASEDCTVSLWNVLDGQEQARLSGHTAAVNSISFSPDGRLLATASDDTSVRLIDRTTGDCILSVDPKIGPVLALAFSADGKTLAVGNQDIQLYKISNLAADKTVVDRVGAVGQVAFHPTQNGLATVCGSHLEHWDLTTAQNVAHWDLNFPKAISCLAFDPKGEYGVLGAAAYRNLPSNVFGVVLFSLKEPPVSTRLEFAPADTRSVAVDATGDWMVAVAHDGTCRLWNARQKREIATWRQENPVRFAVPLAGGQIVICCDAGGTVNCRRIGGDRILAQRSLGLPVTSLALSADGERIVAGTANGTLAIMRPSDLDLTNRIDAAHAGKITALAIGGPDNIVATGGVDKLVRLWISQNGQPICSIPVDVSTVGALAFNPNGTQLAICGSSRLVRVINLSAINGELEKVQPAWMIPGLGTNTTEAPPLSDLPKNPLKITAK